MSTTDLSSTDAPPVPARSRRIVVILALAGIIVLLTLAAAFIVEGLDWFAPQGWALRALAVLGLVAWSPLGLMGRIGAVLLAVGVGLFTVVEVVLAVWPEVGMSGALSGVTIPVFVVGASGFFVLVGGAIRRLRLPWWTTPVIAAVAMAVWAIGILAPTPAGSDELLVQHIVAQNYLFAVAAVSLVAAVIDGVRQVRAVSRRP
ncbi:hypothetical protein [Microcella sp.]|uniref:hypothetical protein n=1 Tax=Microcella sp. TaxID=1913979 RepID=UPI00391B0C83